MRPFRSASAALLACVLGIGPARAAEDTAAAVPGPLRPLGPIDIAPDKTRPGPAQPRAPEPPQRRPQVQAPPTRTAPLTWSATLAPAKRGGEAKGKVVATVATHEIRLTDFAVADRPGLELWLTAADPAAAPGTLMETKHVSLGRLRKPRGDQLYRFPAELDLSVYRTVLVWSRRDRAADAVARLAPARTD